MSDGNAQATSGATDKPTSGGEEGTNVDAKNESSDKKEEFVPSKTYAKLLTEKRNYQERAKALEEEVSKFQREKEEAETRSLEEQNQYKKLYEKAKSELEEKDGKFNGLVNDIQQQRKIAAFVSTLKGQIKPEYHSFIKTDDIVIDSETGEVDQMSVTQEVERFSTAYPELVTRPHEKKSTSIYPQGDSHLGNTIARSEWLKLPAKDMRKWRMSQIINDQ